MNDVSISGPINCGQGLGSRATGNHYYNQADGEGLLPKRATRRQLSVHYRFQSWAVVEHNDLLIMILSSYQILALCFPCHLDRLPASLLPNFIIFFKVRFKTDLDQRMSSAHLSLFYSASRALSTLVYYIIRNL